MKKAMKRLAVLYVFVIFLFCSSALANDTYPYVQGPKTYVADPWGFYQCECTSFVAWCLNNRNGISFSNYKRPGSNEAMPSSAAYTRPNGEWQKGSWGDALHWKTAAELTECIVDNTPRYSCIAYWDAYRGVVGKWGHVAWVSGVDGDQVHIQEYNWETKHGYDERTINVSEPSCYIHINDIPPGTLDVNFNVDGNDQVNIDGIGYIEVLINGSKWKFNNSDTYTDFCRADVPIGCSYEVRLQISNPAYWCAGIAEGTQKGTTGEDVKVRFDIRSLSSGAPDHNLPDGDYIITTAATTDKSSYYYLDIPGANDPAENNENVDIHGPKDGNLSSFDTWSVRYDSNGFYTIKQNGNNMSLSVLGDSNACGANVGVYSDGISRAQRWAITHNGKDGYRIRAMHTGMSLDITGGNVAAGTNVTQYPSHSGTNQSWLFIPYQPQQPLADGRYFLVSGMNHSMELCISDVAGDVSGQENIKLQALDAPDRNNIFELQKLDNGYYLITHVASGKALEVYGGVSENRKVTLYTPNGSLAQQWAITPIGNQYALRVRSSGYAMSIETGLFDGLMSIKQKPYTKSAFQTWNLIRAEYTVHYEMNGGTDPIPDQTKYYGEDLILSEVVPTSDGMVFLGWATNPETMEPVCYPGDLYDADDDLTLYPVWDSAGYKIVYYKGWNGSDAQGLPEPQVFKGSTTISTVIPTCPGFTFKGWTTNILTNQTDYLPGDTYAENADLILYGVWEGNRYMLYLDPNGGECDIIGKTIVNGAMFYPMLPKATRLGYKFAGWHTEKEGGEIYFADKHVHVTEDITYYAHWIKAQQLILPENLTEISDEAFFGSAVEYTVIPPSVKKIGSKAFGDCRQLVSVRIYESTTDIAEDAFSDSSILQFDKLTIYCEENSAAHDLAVNNGIHYVIVTDE